MKISQFFKKLDRKLSRWSDWRCVEPIVVFESDDWGMKRRECTEIVSKYGPAAEWANEDSETIDDLQDLFAVLDQFRGKNERPPCITANFIVANPDYESIERSGFTKYYDKFIDETEPQELFNKYNEGIRKRVFYPQYHGRRHLSATAFVSDLKENSAGARELLKAGCYGGSSLLKGQNWRYHSEYIDWDQKKVIAHDEILKDLGKSRSFFEKHFGYIPKSTIPPHYIFTDETEKAWREAGIKFIQGTGYRLVLSGNEKKIRSQYMGQKSKHGLIYMIRTVKFEPREGRNQGFVEASRNVPSLVKSGIPIVIDTHRINYTGTHKKKGLMQLKEFLEYLIQFDPVFITSVELGEAIENDGTYQDIFSGEKKSLTTKSSVANQFSARLYELIHS
jgi:hypothetical protein